MAIREEEIKLIEKYALWLFAVASVSAIVAIPFHLHSMAMLEQNQKQLMEIQKNWEEYKLQRDYGDPNVKCSVTERMNWVGITSSRSIRCE